MNTKIYFQNPVVNFLLSSIILLIFILSWPGIFSFLSELIKPEENVSEGLTASQYQICSNIYSCLGTVFMGLAFLASFFAFVQTYKQIKESREHHQYERLIKNFDKLTPKSMSAEVCDFLKKLCKWHIDERIWERSLDISPEQTNGYKKLQDEWSNIINKHVRQCLYIILILNYKEKISEDAIDKLLIDAMISQQIGDQEKCAIAALCYAAAKNEVDIKQLFVDAKLDNELMTLERRIHNHILKYTKENGYGDADSAFKEVMSFIQKNYRKLG